MLFLPHSVHWSCKRCLIMLCEVYVSLLQLYISWIALLWRTVRLKGRDCVNSQQFSGEWRRTLVKLTPYSKRDESNPGEKRDEWQERTPPPQHIPKRVLLAGTVNWFGSRQKGGDRRETRANEGGREDRSRWKRKRRLDLKFFTANEERRRRSDITR